MRVVIPDDYQDAVRRLDCFAKLAAHEVTVLPHGVTSGDAEALVLIRERTTVTDELLSRFPNLQLIAQTGRGTAHIDMEACARRGVEVAVGTGSPHAPAELTFALILAASRRICEESSSLRGGGWQTGLGRTLRGRTLGIWGYGKIGSLVAGFGRAFGMNVVAHGRSAPADGTPFEPDRAAFLAAVDVLSLHLRLTKETRGIMRGDDLARMKPDALLVNTARAELIEPGALVTALRAGRPAFAAVDVFENEPAMNDPLLALGNVLATPHLGYVEKDSYELYFGQAFDAVNAFQSRASNRTLT